MPDKHEVGGSTPLEPTTVNEVDWLDFRKRKSVGSADKKTAKIQRRGKE